MERKLIRWAALMAFCLAAQWGRAAAQEGRQSTTGPVPPPGVVSAPVSDAKAAVTLTGVPPYLWRHGCGPTAVGMVVGYWDAAGFDFLIPGSAASQTGDVQQAIASGGGSPSPWPAGSEQHYEDCALPLDTYPNLEQDAALRQRRTPHADNCIADFMQTSRSSAENFYGWSWSSDVPPAFNGYALHRSPYCVPTTVMHLFGSTLTFDVVRREIDAGRPMVFLVDSSGSGSTDHFVTVIGYIDGPPKKYVYYDTWDTEPHEAEFRGLTRGNPLYQWGVWAGWSFDLRNTFVFLSEPEGGTFQEGANLSWTVQVEGAVGTLYYQWLRNSTPVEDGTESTFRIECLTPEDTGWYACEVTDDNGTVMVTRPVYVEVKGFQPTPAAGIPALAAAVLCVLLSARRRLRRG